MCTTYTYFRYFSLSAKLTDINSLDDGVQFDFTGADDESEYDDDEPLDSDEDELLFDAVLFVGMLMASLLGMVVTELMFRYPEA